MNTIQVIDNANPSRPTLEISEMKIEIDPATKFHMQGPDDITWSCTISEEERRALVSALRLLKDLDYPQWRTVMSVEYRTLSSEILGSLEGARK